VVSKVAKEKWCSLCIQNNGHMTHSVEELVEAVFSAHSVPRLYEGQQAQTHCQSAVTPHGQGDFVSSSCSAVLVLVQQYSERFQ
jgi:hypothetical protein